MKKIMLILSVLMLISIVVSSGEKEIIEEKWFGELTPFEAEKFISPEKCAECHEDIFAMWDGSMHSKALDDPLFIAATKLFVAGSTHPGEREDAEHCVSCHNPIAYRSGQIKGASDNYGNTDDVTKWNISCDLCHSIDEIVMLKNVSINATPGDGEGNLGTKLGPHEDVMSMAHESEYSDIHTSSDICGACHNVTHLWYMTKLEGTYDEWYNSPYNSPDPSLAVTCQDCHMRQSPGNPSTGMTERPDFPGSSADMGEERPHIYRHSVVGANAFTPALLGHPEKGDLARERLKHAATLEIIDTTEDGKKVSGMTVRVRNEGAGHMLPTGVTEFRQMWLEITAVDKKGRTVYASGHTDGDGKLPDDTCIFQTVFGDPEGKPTINVTKAAVMLTDHRILPKGWSDEAFHFGENLKKPLTVTVRLNYRSMDPELVSLLLKKDHEVPVVVMTEIVKTIE